MSQLKSYFKDLEKSPFKVRVEEGGKLYSLPSSKQMEMFIRDVQDIKDYYSKGIEYYREDEPIKDIEEAIDYVYNLRKSRW